MKKLTTLNILTNLRKILIQQTTKVTKRKLSKHYANVKVTWKVNDNGVFDPETVIISIDPRKDATVTLILHELLHVWIEMNLKNPISEGLEEELVLSLEKQLFNYLRDKNEKLLDSWTNAIKRKMTPTKG